MDFVEEVRNNPFVAFAVAFIIFYSIFVQKDAKITFFVVATFLVLYILYNNSRNVSVVKRQDLGRFMDKKASALSEEAEVPENKIFYIHKTPPSLKYLKQADDFKQIIYDLKILDIYDSVSYTKLITYVEYFLKVHYKVMIGKYDFDSYFPMLKDIRNEILNTMKGIHYNIPKLSRILDVKDMGALLEEKLLMMQARTYRYMKTLFHKYGSSKDRYQAPFEFDSMKDEHYHIY